MFRRPGGELDEGAGDRNTRDPIGTFGAATQRCAALRMLRSCGARGPAQRVQ
jgi:hypothetical protein